MSEPIRNIGWRAVARRGAPLALVIAGVLVTAGPALAKKPASDLLGIHLGMEDREARKRLLEIGSPQTSTERPKQTWNLKDRRYGSLTIRYDPEWRVMWMTAFARPGARVRYRDIGDIGSAHRSGAYIYTWTLPVHNGRPSAITARGSDKAYLSSVSIHPPGPAPAPADSTTSDPPH